MKDTTDKTALVAIPPEEAWPAIQAIRREHDRTFRRWMPHVTLLYPFRPAERFGQLTGPLAEACAEIEPFEVRLVEFRWFRHNPRSFTFFLAPDPRPLRRLHEAVLAVAPDCDDTKRFAGGFVPHLSVGQANGRDALSRVLASLQSTWRPLSFRVDRISLIRRGDPPDDVFKIDRQVRLGKT